MPRKFAYVPPGTSHNPTTSLSHAQMVPKLMRPSQTSRGKLEDTMIPCSQSQANQHQTTLSQHMIGQQDGAGNMGPPPVPVGRLGTPVTAPDGVRTPHISGRRFVPTQTAQRPQPQPSTSDGPQRFFPSAGINGRSGTSSFWENPQSLNSSGFGNR
jgi:hypothetical protein